MKSIHGVFVGFLVTDTSARTHMIVDGRSMMFHLRSREKKQGLFFHPERLRILLDMEVDLALKVVRDAGRPIFMGAATIGAVKGGDTVELGENWYELASIWHTKMGEMNDHPSV